ncbi:hypothetical protein FQR65_LT13807 [Abscondita terminalis]|nr:hypothetical protein FQR65_LT13807 [Abscondita terminalis]
MNLKNDKSSSHTNEGSEHLSDQPEMDGVDFKKSSECNLNENPNLNSSKKGSCINFLILVLAAVWIVFLYADIDVKNMIHSFETSLNSYLGNCPECDGLSSLYELIGCGVSCRRRNCPTNYNCQKVLERNKSNGKCYFDGQYYDVDIILPGQYPRIDGTSLCTYQCNHDTDNNNYYFLEVDCVDSSEAPTKDQCDKMLQIFAPTVLQVGTAITYTSGECKLGIVGNCPDCDGLSSLYELIGCGVSCRRGKCPTAYNCRNLLIRNEANQQCYFDGQFYDVGTTLPDKYPSPDGTQNCRYQCSNDDSSSIFLVALDFPPGNCSGRKCCSYLSELYKKGTSFEIAQRNCSCSCPPLLLCSN